jgi:hypothetical protein
MDEVRAGTSSALGTMLLDVIPTGLGPPVGKGRKQNDRWAGGHNRVREVGAAAVQRSVWWIRQSRVGVGAEVTYEEGENREVCSGGCGGREVARPGFSPSVYIL